MNKIVSVFNKLRDLTEGLNESVEFLKMDKEFNKEWETVCEKLMYVTYVALQEKKVEAERVEAERVEAERVEAEQLNKNHQEEQLNKKQLYEPHIEARLDSIQKPIDYQGIIQCACDSMKSTKKTLVLHNLPRRVKIGTYMRDMDTRELTEIIRSTFKKYGIILDVYLPLNKETDSQYKGTMKGFALVKFKHIKDAEYAYETESNKMYIYNNLITVEYAKEDRERQNTFI